jgi:L-seryl-tRNA(Ser) seleniumtransferase
MTESMAAGADLVTASGDKLLGGPQAGIVVGSRDYIEALRKHPLARAVRVDKMTVAAMEATLKAYLEPGRAVASVPTLKMLAESPTEVRRRASRLKRLVQGKLLTAEIVGDFSRPGGGTLPTTEIPTFCVALSHPEHSPQELETKLRLGDPPVLGRLKDDRLLLDMRTVADREVPDLARAIEESI